MKEANPTMISRGTQLIKPPFLWVVFLCALSLSANATLIWNAGSGTVSGQRGTISFSKFDPAQGTLVGVILSTSASVWESYYAYNFRYSGAYGTINPGVQAQIASLNNLGLNLSPNTVPMSFYAPGGQYYYDPEDGTELGASPGYISSRYNFGANGLVHDSAHNSLFTGIGTVDLSVGLQITSSLSAPDPNSSSGIAPDYLASSTTVQLSYEYMPVPEPSTYVAGALLLLPLGAGVIRRFRK